MDLPALQSRIADGESLTVEFKGEERAALNDRDLVEAVICLTNAMGGLLLVGVEDDGRKLPVRARGTANPPIRHACRR